MKKVTHKVCNLYNISRESSLVVNSRKRIHSFVLVLRLIAFVILFSCYLFLLPRQLTKFSCHWTEYVLYAFSCYRDFYRFWIVAHVFSNTGVGLPLLLVA